MKKLLTAMFVALLMVGCGGPDLDDKETRNRSIAEAIDAEKLQWRGEEGEELYYAPNKQTPYSGWMKGMYDNLYCRSSSIVFVNVPFEMTVFSSKFYRCICTKQTQFHKLY